MSLDKFESRAYVKTAAARNVVGCVPQFLDSRLPAVFWNRCIPEPMSGCWLWIGTIDKGGYGSANWNIGGRRVQTAYRIAYTVLVGEYQEDLELDHLCRNTLCVNPAHLEPVTQLINLMRSNAPSALNARKEACGVCGGELVDERPGDPNTWRRCRKCRRRTANALGKKRAELGLCHEAASHGPATRGRRCEACAEKHRLDQSVRNRSKKKVATDG